VGHARGSNTRVIATSYDKLAVRYEATLTIAVPKPMADSPAPAGVQLVTLEPQAARAL
jgi:hypothetical protein